jgi:pyruvate dehydrogenase E2 component (dihydrolipoamide acetyltransferase)
MELVARGEGVLRKRLVGENSTSPVGSLIAVIAAPDENIDSLLATAPAAAAPAPAATTAAASEPAVTTAAAPAPAVTTAAAPAPAVTTAASPVPRTARESQGEASTPAQEETREAEPARQGDGRSRSSPLARRLAAERGLDVGRVEGSGPRGRVIKRDIEAAAARAAAPAARPEPAQAPRPAVRPPTGADYEDVPLTQIRKTIARRLGESIGPIPTFYLTADFDMERVTEMRASMVELGDEYKVSFNDIILKATATALVQHPECNAHWLGDHIRYFTRVHLGMAVAIDEGLITPVIFDADRKRLSEISAEARELAGRARERRLKPEEYTGATFSISNLGMFGIEHFTAIINPPECGILAVGAVEPRPVPDGRSGVAIRRRMNVTMSCDHRVIDGATGARFLQTLRRLIENPLMLVY